MLGFHPVAGRPVASGTGRRWTLITGMGAGGADSTGTTARASALALAGAGGGAASGTTIRATSPGDIYAGGAWTVVSPSIRITSVGLAGAAAFDAQATAIRITRLVVMLGGLCGAVVAADLLGRPGTPVSRVSATEYERSATGSAFRAPSREAAPRRGGNLDLPQNLLVPAARDAQASEDRVLVSQGDRRFGLHAAQRRTEVRPRDAKCRFVQ
jgi:hypothetical protein